MKKMIIGFVITIMVVVCGIVGCNVVRNTSNVGAISAEAHLKYIQKDYIHVTWTFNGIVVEEHWRLRNHAE